jgi:hypothetical protein
MLVACLETKMVFKTITLVDGSFHIVDNNLGVSANPEEIFYEPNSRRLFVLEKTENYLSEIVLQPDCDSVTDKLMDCFGLSSKCYLKKIKTDQTTFYDRVVNMVAAPATAPRSHLFHFERSEGLLYHLTNKWIKGSVNPSQHVSVYGLANGRCEYAGRINLRNILIDNSVNKNIHKKVLSQIEGRRIVGFKSPDDSSHNLCLVFEGSFHVKLQVLQNINSKQISNVAYKGISAINLGSPTTGPQPHPTDDSLHHVPLILNYQYCQNISAGLVKKAVQGKIIVSVESNISLNPPLKIQKEKEGIIVKQVENLCTASTSVLLEVSLL